MYIRVIRQIIDNAVGEYAADFQMAREAVLREIRSHINATSDAYFKQGQDPDITYTDPLCRLGYLYRHGPAQATLFERVVGQSPDLQGVLQAHHDDVLSICSIGGGPGTELLGQAKYLTKEPRYAPKEIEFTVIDRVQEWQETWLQLADEVKRVLVAEEINLSKTFLHFDGMADSSYQNFPFQFKRADIVVCNCLFSENKSKIKDSKDMLGALSQKTPDKCNYVVIDRFERHTGFINDVCTMFESVFGKQINADTLGWVLDPDEQIDDMGDLRPILGDPRVNFRNNRGEPTMFWFVTKQA